MAQIWIPAIAAIFGQAAAVTWALMRPQLSMSNQVSKLCTCLRFVSAAVKIFIFTSCYHLLRGVLHIWDKNSYQMIRKLSEAMQLYDFWLDLLIRREADCAFSILSPRFRLFLNTSFVRLHIWDVRCPDMSRVFCVPFLFLRILCWPSIPHLLTEPVTVSQYFISV